MGDFGIFSLVIFGELLFFFRNLFINFFWLFLLMSFFILEELFNCFFDNIFIGFFMIFIGDGFDNK